MLPSSAPIINSFGVCAFIAKREEATKPFAKKSKAMGYVFFCSSASVNPITKQVNPLIVIICRLAFIVAKSNKRAITVLNKPAKKKKCNSGYCARVMFCRNRKIIKKHWIINGILRCDTSAIIIEATFPVARNSR